MSVPLNRALSKLGILSRARATAAIVGGRVRVNGKTVTDPAAPVIPERVRIEIDGAVRPRAAWRTIIFHKPRGMVTTRRDPEGRPTVFDLLGAEAEGLVAVGRLDLATTGLLLLTTDTRLADWMTDPLNQVPRVYAVTVRGRIEDAHAERLTRGIRSRGELLTAGDVAVRKASSRESHLMVTLREGRNREIRRLFEAIGHEVTRLKRVRFGALELDDLAPGKWREVTRAELRRAFGRDVRLEPDRAGRLKPAPPGGGC
jgi:23S rRNA pseudouridine2605 synthase